MFSYMPIMHAHTSPYTHTHVLTHTLTQVSSEAQLWEPFSLAGLRCEQKQGLASAKIYCFYLKCSQNSFCATERKGNQVERGKCRKLYPDTEQSVLGQKSSLFEGESRDSLRGCRMDAGASVFLITVEKSVTWWHIQLYIVIFKKEHFYLLFKG